MTTWGEGYRTLQEADRREKITSVLVIVAAVVLIATTGLVVAGLWFKAGL